MNYLLNSICFLAIVPHFPSHKHIKRILIYSQKFWWHKKFSIHLLLPFRVSDSQKKLLAVYNLWRRGKKLTFTTFAKTKSSSTLLVSPLCLYSNLTRTWTFFSPSVSKIPLISKFTCTLPVWASRLTIAVAAPGPWPESEVIRAEKIRKNKTIFHL